MGKLFKIICEIFQKQNLYVSLKKRRHKEKNHIHGPNAQMCMPAKNFRQQKSCTNKNSQVTHNYTVLERFFQKLLFCLPIETLSAQ